MKTMVWACALAAMASPAAAATTPALTAFDEAFAKVNDYTVTVRAHEVLGTRVQDRTYQYAFKRPNMAKTAIVAGDGRGTGGVWDGGTTIKGYARIAFIIVRKTFNIHDARATSLRGYTIPDGLIQNQVAKYREIGGTLRERTGPAIEGATTDEVDLNVGDPHANGGITRAVLYLSRTTHFPVRQLRYEGNTVVADETLSDLKTNVGLTPADFRF